MLAITAKDTNEKVPNKNQICELAALSSADLVAPQGGGAKSWATRPFSGQRAISHLLGAFPGSGGLTLTRMGNGHKGAAGIERCTSERSQSIWSL